MTLEEEFEAIIARMEESCHGSECWQDLGAFFQNKIRNTAERLEFLSSRLIQPPVQWEDIRERVWQHDEGQQEANRFAFLQGDLLNTALVQTLIDQTGTQLQVFGPEKTDHDLWMVSSPDCDALRADLVRVSPVFEVRLKVDDKLHAAAAFKSPHRFPLPRLPGDVPEILARYVDLARMFFLDCRDGQRFLPTRVASLTDVGWHMFNAHLIQQLTRAENKQESIAIRTARPIGLDVPA